MVLETLAAKIERGGTVVLGVTDSACSMPEQLVDHRRAHINGGKAFGHRDFRGARGKHEVAIAILEFIHRAADELGQLDRESFRGVVILFTGCGVRTVRADGAGDRGIRSVDGGRSLDGKRSAERTAKDRHGGLLRTAPASIDRQIPCSEQGYTPSTPKRVETGGCRRARGRRPTEKDGVPIRARISQPVDVAAPRR
jgi:hypothetical protein